MDLRFEPRSIKVPDKRKRKDDEKEQNTCDQYQNTENPSQIALKGDVAKPECAHHRQDPVETRDPRMLPPFIQHDEVKKHGKYRDYQEEKHEEANQRPNVLPDGPIAQVIRDLCADKFHRHVSGGEGLRLVLLNR